MDYGLIFAPTALSDFEAIIGALNYDDANASSRFAHGLLDHVELLRRFPGLGLTVPNGRRSVNWYIVRFLFITKFTSVGRWSKY